MGDVEDIRTHARPLTDDADLDPLLEKLGDAHLVLIGEASHGTEEFYAWRDRLTRRLVAEADFSFVAVEGDWPDCRVLHRWIVDADAGPEGLDAALAAYDRWPTWMWANTAIRTAATWLHEHNAASAPDRRVGFHGLDVYSLWRSLREVVDWLRENEPDLVDTALAAYRCFEPFGEDPQTYARATRLVPETCEERVLEVLRRMCERAASAEAADADRFVAEQNAAVVAGAEEYYRAMVRGGGEAWNVRDIHMADTLDRLLDHHGGVAGGAKGVVWAHNTHVGDARATDMAARGMVNLGQLARERHGEDGVLVVGAACHRGSVLAGAHWGAPAQAWRVPPGRSASAEDLLHEALGDEPALLAFPPAYDQSRWLRTSLDHRAIGVVYDPRHESWANYVPSTLGDRYDALLWFGETHALTPVHGEPEVALEPETYPFGE
jgi:erythromycin esterase-like protein